MGLGGPSPNVTCYYHRLGCPSLVVTHIVLISSTDLCPFSFAKLSGGFRHAVIAKLQLLKVETQTDRSMASKDVATTLLACCSDLILGFDDMLANSLQNGQMYITVYIEDRLIGFADVIKLFISSDCCGT